MKRIGFISAAYVAALSIGCSSSGTGAAGTGSVAASTGTSTGSSSGAGAGGLNDAGAGGTGGAASVPPGDGPQFVTFATDVTTVTEGGTVTFLAVLSDPQGTSDLAGGTLSDPAGTFYYGKFAPSGQPGGYQLAVAWAELNKVQPINLPPGETVVRSFSARFFDLESHGAQRSVTVTLTCNGLASCAGTCADTLADPKACSTCADCSEIGCYLGSCAALTSCQGSSFTSCRAACAANGMACANQCLSVASGVGIGGVGYRLPGCQGTAQHVLCDDAISAFSASACCCF